MATSLSNRSWRITVPTPNSPGSSSTFLCSSDPNLIQIDALAAALGSEMMWWSSPLTKAQLATVVQNCVMLGVYDESSPGKPMIGSARLVTDKVTFAYLTDVYVLPQYQKRGLGAWLMRCLREFLVGDYAEKNGGLRVAGSSVAKGSEAYAPPDGLSVGSWPSLRSLWLIASTPAAARMYAEALQTEEVARYRPTPGVPDSGMIMLEMMGPANGTKRHLEEHGTKTPY